MNKSTSNTIFVVGFLLVAVMTVSMFWKKTEAFQMGPSAMMAPRAPSAMMAPRAPNQQMRDLIMRVDGDLVKRAQNLKNVPILPVLDQFKRDVMNRETYAKTLGTAYFPLPSQVQEVYRMVGGIKLPTF